MGADSRIEWCQHTFNPFIGCTKVSPGCDHCYAETWAKRSGLVVWGGERRRTSDANWRLPLKWNAQAEREGRRSRVFCASLADVFDNDVPIEWFTDLLYWIYRTPNLDWLLLSKRIGNCRKRLHAAKQAMDFSGNRDFWLWVTAWLDGDAPPNVWVGATVVTQEEADRDVPKLLQVPARVRFLSIEPMLGPISLRWLPAWPENAPIICQRPDSNTTHHLDGLRRIDWIIAGGESGPKARPMHPEWVRSLRDQCQEAGVPFLFKQHGEWLATTFCDDDMAMLPSKRTAYVRLDGSTQDGSDGIDFFGGDEEVAWVGKKAAGRLLDGKLHDEYPQP